MRLEHRFIRVSVVDRVPAHGLPFGVLVIGSVAACTCGWSGMKIHTGSDDWKKTRRQFNGHKAQAEHWEPILEARRRAESNARVAAAVAERKSKPCPRCDHWHIRDSVFTCQTDCATCNPALSNAESVV